MFLRRDGSLFIGWWWWWCSEREQTHKGVVCTPECANVFACALCRPRPVGRWGHASRWTHDLETKRDTHTIWGSSPVEVVKKYNPAVYVSFCVARMQDSSSILLCDARCTRDYLMLCISFGNLCFGRYWLRYWYQALMLKDVPVIHVFYFKTHTTSCPGADKLRIASLCRHHSCNPQSITSAVCVIDW